MKDLSRRLRDYILHHYDLVSRKNLTHYRKFLAWQEITALKMNFPIKDLLTECAYLITFTEKILNGKLPFLCSRWSSYFITIAEWIVNSVGNRKSVNTCAACFETRLIRWDQNVFHKKIQKISKNKQYWHWVNNYLVTVCQLFCGRVQQFFSPFLRKNILFKMRFFSCLESFI